MLLRIVVSCVRSVPILPFSIDTLNDTNMPIADTHVFCLLIWKINKTHTQNEPLLSGFNIENKLDDFNSRIFSGCEWYGSCNCHGAGMRRSNVHLTPRQPATSDLTQTIDSAPWMYKAMQIIHFMEVQVLAWKIDSDLNSIGKQIEPVSSECFQWTSEIPLLNAKKLLENHASGTVWST